MLSRFNEAAGIHRRKPTPSGLVSDSQVFASMRPPEFTGGNIASLQGYRSPATPGFNEAAGIHRRKPPSRSTGICRRSTGFNEAAGIHRRKHLTMGERFKGREIASMRPPEFTGGNVLSVFPACGANTLDLQ